MAVSVHNLCPFQQLARIHLLIALTALLSSPLPAVAACGNAPTSTTVDGQIRLKGSGSYGNVSGIGTAAEGDVVYDSTNHDPAYCNGTSWVDLGAAAGIAVQNNVTSSRAGDTVYQNTTGKMMLVEVVLTTGKATGPIAVCYSDASSSPTTQVSSSALSSGAGTTFVVLSNNYYECGTVSNVTINSWIEITMPY